MANLNDYFKYASELVGLTRELTKPETDRLGIRTVKAILENNMLELSDVDSNGTKSITAYNQSQFNFNINEDAIVLFYDEAAKTPVILGKVNPKPSDDKVFGLQNDVETLKRASNVGTVVKTEEITTSSGGTGTTYVSGDGIDISGNVISNTYNQVTGTEDGTNWTKINIGGVERNIPTGGGGGSYTAGGGILIDNNVISVKLRTVNDADQSGLIIDNSGLGIKLKSARSGLAINPTAGSGGLYIKLKENSQNVNESGLDFIGHSLYSLSHMRERINFSGLGDGNAIGFLKVEYSSESFSDGDRLSFKINLSATNANNFCEEIHVIAEKTSDGAIFKVDNYITARSDVTYTSNDIDKYTGDIFWYIDGNEAYFYILAKGSGKIFASDVQYDGTNGPGYWDIDLLEGDPTIYSEPYTKIWADNHYMPGAIVSAGSGITVNPSTGVVSVKLSNTTSVGNTSGLEFGGSNSGLGIKLKSARSGLAIDPTAGSGGLYSTLSTQPYITASASGFKAVKFLYISYQNETYSQLGIKLTLSSYGTDNHKNRIHEDVYIHVDRSSSSNTIEIGITNYQYHLSNTIDYDNASHNSGDIFYTIDQTNRVIDFYVLMSSDGTLSETPYQRLNETIPLQYDYNIIQPTTYVEYSTGIKIWGHNYMVSNMITDIGGLKGPKIYLGNGLYANVDAGNNKLDLKLSNKGLFVDSTGLGVKLRTNQEGTNISGLEINIALQDHEGLSVKCNGNAGMSVNENGIAINLKSSESGLGFNNGSTNDDGGLYVKCGTNSAITINDDGLALNIDNGSSGLDILNNNLFVKLKDQGGLAFDNAGDIYVSSFPSAYLTLGSQDAFLFLTVKYNLATSNQTQYFKITMSSSGPGSFYEDVYFRVGKNSIGNVVVYANNYQTQSSSETYDDKTHYTGDIFWVNDDKNTQILFYVLMGGSGTLFETPYQIIGADLTNKFQITQIQSGSTAYTGKTRNWINNKYCVKSQTLKFETRGGNGVDYIPFSSINTTTIKGRNQSLNDSGDIGQFVEIATDDSDTNTAMFGLNVPNLIKRLKYEGFVTCLIEGTKILMADGTEKPIENITPGDMITSYNPVTQEKTEAMVLYLDFTGYSQNFEFFLFDDGNYLEIYQHHPIWNDHERYIVNSKRWNVGNIARSSSLNQSTLANIKSTYHGIPKSHYTLITSNNLYFANNILCGHNDADKYTIINKRNEELNIPNSILATWKASSEAEDVMMNHPIPEEELVSSAEFLKERNLALAQQKNMQNELDQGDHEDFKAMEAVLRSIQSIDTTSNEAIISGFKDVIALTQKYDFIRRDELRSSLKAKRAEAKEWRYKYVNNRTHIKNMYKDRSTYFIDTVLAGNAQLEELKEWFATYKQSN